MLSVSVVVVGLAVVLALMALGGGAYEVLVVDAAWPRRPDIIQPERGGISRRRFWIPAHGAFESCLLVALVSTWGAPHVRVPLLISLGSHAVMRVWSFADFIPKAAAFERMDPASVEASAAQRWARRSMARLPLDLVTCAALLTAFVSAARLR
jgi:hypothetical protein